jgi:phospholipase C
MEGPDWNSTVAFITWDDFSGFYDHVAPPKVDDSAAFTAVESTESFLVQLGPDARTGAESQ